MSNTSVPFVALESVCYYPRSTIYDACPRYLFYALLFAACAARWVGWLADVFLGAAATYAGTAAIQAFILVATPAWTPLAGTVSISLIPAAMNATKTLWDMFPGLVTDANQVLVQPAAFELDADAILAIVTMGYLFFLPLQCWSRVATHDRSWSILLCLWNAMMLAGTICALIYWPTLETTPTQYMFCDPSFAPLDRTTSDGWQPFWRTSTWNESVWNIFTNQTRFLQLGEVCFSPCFNTSQILRQQISLTAAVLDEDPGHNHSWNRIASARGYIYTLIVLNMVLNYLLLAVRMLPHPLRIKSTQPMTIWKESRVLLSELRTDLSTALKASRAQRQYILRASGGGSFQTRVWAHIWSACTFVLTKSWLHFLVSVAMLGGLLFSMIISPLTIIAFLVWVELCIHNDGAPEQELPQQVGQWTYLASIGLLVISAAILKLRYRVASRAELDSEIELTRKHLETLQEIRYSKATPHGEYQVSA
ncbi:hypothetical protein BDW75DRAFT_249022 [Aspergillus navahoensis]